MKTRQSQDPNRPRRASANDPSPARVMPAQAETQRTGNATVARRAVRVAYLVRTTALIFLTLLPGCALAPDLQFSAADSLSALAHTVESTLGEYHQSTNDEFDRRQRVAAQAFIDAVRQSNGDPQQIEAQAAELLDALAAADAQRDTESQRFGAVRETAQGINKVAGDLRQAAEQSHAIQSELKSMFNRWFPSKKPSNEPNVKRP